MLNFSKKYGKIQDKLQQITACIFAQQFNASKFFPSLTHICDDPDLVQPTSIIFAIYNLLIRQQPQIAFNCLKKVENHNQKSAANVAAHVIKSAYLAYTKKYRQSLDALSTAVDICEQQPVDKQLNSFYGYCITKMIQIHDFAAFRKQYINLIQKILVKYESFIDHCQILKSLSQHKEIIQQKVCIPKKRINLGDYMGNSKRSSKLKLLKSEQSEKSQKAQKQKSMSSSKRSNLYSPSSKHFMKDLSRKKYVNPYGLVYAKSQKNNCIFM